MKQIRTIVLAVVLLAAAAFLTPAMAEEASADVTRYTYEVMPLLAPFNEYLYVRTDNPDPTGFRFVDRNSVYDEGVVDYGAVFMHTKTVFADVAYEDEATLRINGGYLFKAVGALSDGGEMVLQQRPEGAEPYTLTNSEDTWYTDTAVTVFCETLMDARDYLIMTCTDSEKTLFDNLDAVQKKLDEIALYPCSTLDMDKPTGMYPRLSSSPYPELSLNQSCSDVYESVNMLISRAYPFVLDSLAFPSMMRQVALALDSEASIVWGSLHYEINVTSGSVTKTYGGAGRGGSEPLDVRRIGTLFTFGGEEGDFGLNGSVERYETALSDFRMNARADVSACYDQISGETFRNTVRECGGSWIRIAIEGIMPLRTGYAYIMKYGGRALSDTWVDGRYINELERLEPGAAFSEHPNAAILVRDLTYMDQGEEMTEDTVFRYSADFDVWIAEIAGAGDPGELPAAFVLSRAEIEAMGVDRNTDIPPRSGLIYDGYEAPGTPFGALTGVCGEDVAYAVDPEKGTLTLTGSGGTNGYSLASLTPWYVWRDVIREVRVSEGITALGSFLLADLASLEEVRLPETLTEIGYGSIQRCTSLPSVKIPAGVTTIGRYAFYGCSALESAPIPDGVEQIGTGAFDGCDVIGIKKSGTCGERLAYTLTNTGELTIYGKGDMKDYLRNGLYSYEAPWIYLDAGMIKSVTVRNGVTSIGNNAFARCPQLVSATLPETLTRIGIGAFSQCERLASVTIPQGTARIGSSAFFGCTSLTELELPEGVTEVGDLAFYRCTALAKLTMPKTLRSIGCDVLRECASLTELELPAGVTEIGSGTFYGCTALKTIRFGGTLDQWLAFGFNLDAVVQASDDTILDSGECGASVRYVRTEKGSLIISGTGAMGNYFNDRRAPWNTVSEQIRSVTVKDGVSSIGGYAFSECVNLTEVTISPDVTYLGIGAFYGCSGLEEFELPPGVRIIPMGVFYRCSGLRSVTIPAGVKEIDQLAFLECTSLQSLELPAGLESIGYAAFYGCENLACVTIPDTVTRIEAEEFDACSSLKDVWYGGTQAQWAEIRILSPNEGLLSAVLHCTDDPAPEPPTPPAPTEPGAGSELPPEAARRLSGGSTEGMNEAAQLLRAAVGLDHGHVWSEWTASPEEAGTEVRTCIACGEGESRPSGLTDGAAAPEDVPEEAEPETLETLPPEDDDPEAGEPENDELRNEASGNGEPEDEKPENGLAEADPYAAVNDNDGAEDTLHDDRTDKPSSEGA